jgi:flagellar M-ring protein FliF
MSTNTATLAPGLMPGMGPASSTSLATTGSGAVQVAGAPGVAAQSAASLVPFNGPQMLNGVRNVLTQPAVRRALPAIVMLVVLILFGVVYAMMQATPHRPVMPGLQEADQQLAFDALKGADFKPRIDASTGQLTVPSNRFHEARIFLASQGLPRGGAVGLDALKDQSSMTTSQFMEQVKVNAAMEQELARSVMQIATVLSARVHLATPRQSVFVRERVPPKASVVLAPQPGRMVSPSQVQAIVHLVSSSVPYLAPEYVTVVDNVGNLLTDSAAELKLGLTAAQTQHKQQLEEVYRNRINQILSPMVGEANVRTQVNLALDFTQSETTTEDFDNQSRGPRTRSEVLAEDRAARREAAGIPGALANTAPVDAATSTNTQADPNKGRSEAEGTLSSRSTRNYELDRTVRYEKKATGNVQRLSVAVVINERPAPAPKEREPAPATPAPTSVAYTPQELERMQELVRGVVGFDQARGDVVAVVPARFEAPPVLDTIPWYLEDTVHTGIKSGLLALIFVVFMLVVVRPLMRSIAYAQSRADEAAQAKTKVADGELSEEDMRMIQIGEGESLEEIKAKLKPKKSSISIDMLDTANTYDDKVALIRMLVAEDSGRVANVLKGMIRVS